MCDAGGVGIAVAVLWVGEGDERRAAREEGAAVVDDGDAGDGGDASGGGRARPCVEEVGGADAVAEAVVDGRAQHHAAAPQMSHLPSNSEFNLIQMVMSLYCKLNYF